MTDRTTPDRRSLLFGPALGVLLMGCAAIAGAELPSDLAAPFGFDRHEVFTGPAKGQTVLPGFLLGGAMADLAVASVYENGDRRLSIYAFGEGAWERRLHVTLRPEVLFVDVANIGGRDRLITYERGRLSWLDPESATERALVEVATSYNATPLGLAYAGAELEGPADEGEVPRLEIARDLNRDGRDDLVLPDLDGFWVSVQTSDGAFAEPVKLGPPEPFRDAVAYGETRSYGEVGISALTLPWYLGRIHQMDYDQDGRSDLVFWNGDHFEVHRQDARGGFDPEAETFTVDVPFDSDGPYSLMFGFEDASAFALFLGLRKSEERTVLHSFRDMNADRVADLVTLTHSGRSLLRQRTRYEVHYGTPTPDGILFTPDAGAAIEPRARAPLGYSFEWLRDVDGDGQVDVMHGNVKTGFVKMIRALLGTSISMGLEVYRVEDGAYPAKATTTRRIRADLDIEDGRDAGFWPAVLVGDVNGDGRADFLVGKNREKLHVFLGVPAPELLARQPREVAVALPGDERNSWLVDLDRDGKQDVLMHHPSATEPHRLTMLIAR